MGIPVYNSLKLISNLWKGLVHPLFSHIPWFDHRQLRCLSLEALTESRQSEVNYV